MKIKLLILFIFSGFNSLAQISSLQDIVSLAEIYQKQLPLEKVYLHLDKPAYTSGDTIWLKAYLLDGAFLTASGQSGILYLELANDTGIVVQRRIMRIMEGLGSGNIPLDAKDIPPGSYTLRAYTNLMRNFGNEVVFSKDLYISSSSENHFLVASNSVMSKSGTKDSLQVSLKFSRLDNSSMGFHDFQLRVTDGRRVYLRDDVKTLADGSTDVNFILPDGADPGKITLVAVEKTKGAIESEVRIPLTVNRPGHIDLQFMPESGYLVAGLPVRVGFKALAENGSGVEVSGGVYNLANQKVADFTTTHKGMGSFELYAQPGEVYTARINASDKVWTLPAIKDSGTGLRIINDFMSDSLEVFVTFSPGLEVLSDYYLIGQYEGVICYAGLIKGNSRLRIPVKLFSSGIARFTLMNSDGLPLNERIVFIDHKDELNISIKSDKESYGIRDSVRLDIMVTDKDGQPVQGSFSMAVTDDRQVKAGDSLGNMIRANMLLSADLRGTIETPGYYLQRNEKSWQALDNLLLTQGWVGYEWPKVFKFAEAEYKAEPEFRVEGKVVNVMGRTLSGAKVRLLSPRPFMVADTFTDSAGRFRFDNFGALDTTVIFRLQAKNLKGRNMNVGISMNEFDPPAFENSKYAARPWYVNTDTVLINQVKSAIEEDRALLNLPKGAKLLEEVVVSAKKIIPHSKNLNGSGISDFAMTENEIVNSGKMSLLKLIQQKVPKFFAKYFPPPVKEYFYTINGAKVNIVMDGVPLDYFYTPQYCGEGKCPRDYMDFITRFLEYFTTEDVIGIEVMNWGKNSYRYTAEFPQDNSSIVAVNGLSGMIMIKTASQPAYSWIEITTRSGNGPLFMSEPGSYVYRPPAFISGKEFYKPRYTMNDQVTLPDLRSTIHWEPWITTDEKGCAKVSFYSSDNPGNYSISIQGADMDGGLGSTITGVKIE